MKLKEDLLPDHYIESSDEVEQTKAIGSMFPMGELCTIIAEQGTGKSVLSASIVKQSLAEGLGVVYIDADASGIERVFRKMGVEPSNEENLLIINRASSNPAVDWTEETVGDILTQLRNGIDPSNPETHLIVVDTVSELFGYADHNDAVRARAMMRALKLLATSTGVCVLALDHTSKGQHAHYYSAQSATGSSQKANTTSVSFLLKSMPSKDGVKRIRLSVAKDRSALYAETEKHATGTFEKDEDGFLSVRVDDWRAGPNPTRRLTAAEAKARLAKQPDNIHDRIKTFLSSCENASWNEIRSAVKGNAEIASCARDELLVAGVIEQVDPGSPRSRLRLAVRP